MNLKMIKSMAAVVAFCAAGVVNAATISLTATPTTVNIGDSFSLDVSGSAFDTGLTTGSLRLSWDPADLTLNTPDTDILSAVTGLGFLGTPFSSVAINDVAGTVDIVMGSLPPGVLTPGGLIDFFTLNFTADAGGAALITSELGFSEGVLGSWGDTTSTDITSAMVYGDTTVTVNAVPVPAAVWLFGSGLLGLVGVARRTA
jgi:hypothetical protein